MKMKRKGLWKTRFDQLWDALEGLPMTTKWEVVECVYNMLNASRAFHYAWIASTVYEKLKYEGKIKRR